MHNTHIIEYIPKKDLVDKAIYEGHCRNTTEAKWNAKANLFIYIRTKFGTKFPETICHPEDDNGYDLFYPTKLKE